MTDDTAPLKNDVGEVVDVVEDETLRNVDSDVVNVAAPELLNFNEIARPNNEEPPAKKTQVSQSPPQDKVIVAEPRTRKPSNPSRTRSSTRKGYLFRTRIAPDVDVDFESEFFDIIDRFMTLKDIATRLFFVFFLATKILSKLRKPALRKF
jgi:hypothetical protein